MKLFYRCLIPFLFLVFVIPSIVLGADEPPREPVKEEGNRITENAVIRTPKERIVENGVIRTPKWESPLNWD